MSAKNRRVRRAIVDIMWDYGPLSKNTLADKLQEIKSLRQVPSPNSLSALLCKNPQIIAVGKVKVESAAGVKNEHLVFDINRELIQDRGDLLYTRPYNIMTPAQKKLAIKCPTCGKRRIFPNDKQQCLACVRDGDK